jgi:CPSF A subunit region
VSSPLLGSTRLVTSLAVIKNQYMAVGNTRKGITFLHVQTDRGTLSLTSRDFALSDTSAVDFLFEGKLLGFFQADTRGNVAVFKWQKGGSAVYDPPGVRAMPVGRYHLGHQVRTLRLTLHCCVALLCMSSAALERWQCVCCAAAYSVT